MQGFANVASSSDLGDTVLGDLPIELLNTIQYFGNMLRQTLAEPITREEIAWLVEVRHEITIFCPMEDSCETQPWTHSRTGKWICVATHVEYREGLIAHYGHDGCNDSKTMVDWIVQQYTAGGYLDLRSYFMIINERCKKMSLPLARAQEIVLEFLAARVAELQVQPIGLEMYLFANTELLGLCQDVPRSSSGWRVGSLDIINRNIPLYRTALEDAIQTLHIE